VIFPIKVEVCQTYIIGYEGESEVVAANDALQDGELYERFNPLLVTEWTWTVEQLTPEDLREHYAVVAHAMEMAR
jgi:hypothetical protein